MACKNVHVIHFKKKKSTPLSVKKKKSTPPPTEKKKITLGSKPGPPPRNQMGRPLGLFWNYFGHHKDAWFFVQKPCAAPIKDAC